MSDALKQAARQALEALHVADDLWMCSDSQDRMLQSSIKALTAALSKPEPEAVQHPTITKPYTLDELRAKIASHDYSAELLLQHAMLLLDRSPEAVQVPHVRRYTIDEIADACVQAEISDGHFESLSIALLDSHRPQSAATQPPAQAEARGDEPELASNEVNEACWAFIETMPHSLPGPIWNNLKPAVHAAICKYLKLTRPAPAAPQAGEADWRSHVEKRLASWRQRHVNKSGDQLALDDFMDRESLDDLLDYVLSEYEGPASQPMSREGMSDPETVALIEECRDAFDEELSAWDLDPPLHHVLQGYEKCVAWLAAHGIGSGSGTGASHD